MHHPPRNGVRLRREQVLEEGSERIGGTPRNTGRRACLPGSSREGGRNPVVTEDKEEEDNKNNNKITINS